MIATKYMLKPAQVNALKAISKPPKGTHISPSFANHVLSYNSRLYATNSYTAVRVRLKCNDLPDGDVTFGPDGRIFVDRYPERISSDTMSTIDEFFSTGAEGTNYFLNPDFVARVARLMKAFDLTMLFRQPKEHQAVCIDGLTKNLREIVMTAVVMPIRNL